MELSDLITSHSVLGIGLLICLISITGLLMSKRQRQVVLDRLHFSRRRNSGAKTPPRSLSPYKADSNPPAAIDKSFVVDRAAQDLINSFPPLRRDVLTKLAETANATDKKTLIGPEPSKEFLRDHSLPTTRSYDLDNDSPKYTPTGFSTSEIKAMGDFPAYDILSGVPLPEAYENFDLSKAHYRPYRPFRWAYHQTMSLTKMEPDWWLEVSHNYTALIKERKRLYEVHGKQVLDYLPGSQLVCKELMEMCLQFYCARYPTLFHLSRDQKTFHNNILHNTTDLSATHPLLVLLENVPEDFAIVLRNENDGMYYFRAGVICSSLGWSVATKLGMCMQEIHKPIPDYKEKMQFSMDRYFSKMPTNAPIQRGSWGLEIGTPLFMPPGDPHEAERAIQKDGLEVEGCSLRVDWQTLRRLPLSAGVVFNFKAIFTPVEEFRDEPFVPALLLKILKEGKKNLMEYKNTWHVEHACIPSLERYAKDQVERGLVPEDWEVETLPESPYFPGWEEKWKKQQGL